MSRGNLVRQNAVLAKFGNYALQADSLDAILHEACRLVSEALQSDMAKLLELQQDRRTLVIRAAIGWDKSLVGQILPGCHSAEWYALRSGRPVICNDVDAETRFAIPRFVIDQGVKSIVNVQVPGSAGRPPYGVLQVDSCKRREFGQRDVDFLVCYANLLASSVDRLRMVPRLEAALETKAYLLTELQHRTKNNLQFIANLVHIHAGKARAQGARRHFDALAERVQTLLLINDQLYLKDGVETVNLGRYLREVSSRLLTFHTDESRRIALVSDIPDLEAKSDVALTLGMIVSEFVTNSLKYAFTGRSGTIGLQLTCQDGGSGLLVLWDSGVGIPDEVCRSGGAAGSGLQIIGGLASHIGNGAEWEHGRNGAYLKVRFPIPVAREDCQAAWDPPSVAVGQ
jgi:two-component sensor histidine kinase